MKRVFIVHRWGGSPSKDWMRWAKLELKNRRYQVNILRMPQPDYPKIDKWVDYLAEVVGKPQPEDILIGHSMGCQTILRYLENLAENETVDNVILVAGFVHLTGLTAEEVKVAKPWLESQIDFEKVVTKANSFIAIFSDNDPFVPVKESSEIFQRKLGARIIIENNKGHFNQGKLPILLELL